MNSVVEAFNSLPRQELTPSGVVSNHWHFSVRHVPLDPPGDLLFILNPGARYIHVEGPAPILSMPISAQARIIVPLLLKAFNDGLGNSSSATKLAPWTWSTTSSELARAVESRLLELGVMGEVAKVGSGDTEEEKVASEEWERFMNQLKSVHLS